MVVYGYFPYIFALAIFSIISPQFDLSKRIKAPGFQVFPTERYTVGKWAAIFQVLEAEATKKWMLQQYGIRISKGESFKSRY